MQRDLAAELRALDAEIAAIEVRIRDHQRARDRIRAGDGLARILATPAAELREPPQSAPITGA